MSTTPHTLNANDPDAHLLSRARWIARQVARRSPDGSADFEDYAQDAVLAVLERRRHRPDDPETLTIELKRRAIDARRMHLGRIVNGRVPQRSASRRVPLNQTLIESHRAYHPQAGKDMADRELVDLVLGCLSPKRADLLRKQMQGMTLPQIAAAVGCSQAGVSTRVVQSRRMVRKRLPQLAKLL